MSRTGPAEPVLLGGYAAKQCPVRTHNDFAPLVPVPEWVPSAELQALFDAGRQFEAEVVAELITIHPDTAELIDRNLRKPAAIAKTLATMDSGAPIVLGGWLPDDIAGGRKGRPDVLVKVGGGYLPADVKHHKTLGDATRASKPVSSLVRPDIWWEVPGCTATSHHYEDGLQLAHYTRFSSGCFRPVVFTRDRTGCSGRSSAPAPWRCRAASTNRSSSGTTCPPRRGRRSPAAEARPCGRCWNATTTNTTSG